MPPEIVCELRLGSILIATIYAINGYTAVVSSPEFPIIQRDKISSLAGVLKSLIPNPVKDFAWFVFPDGTRQLYLP